MDPTQQQTIFITGISGILVITGVSWLSGNIGFWSYTGLILIFLLVIASIFPLVNHRVPYRFLILTILLITAIFTSLLCFVAIVQEDVGIILTRVALRQYLRS